MEYKQRPPVTFIAWNTKNYKREHHDKYETCVNHVQQLFTHDSDISSCLCCFLSDEKPQEALWRLKASPQEILKWK